MDTIRTLLVEDNADYAQLIRARLRMLRTASFRVEHVPTLVSAVTRLREGGVDVVLLDLGLPDSAGVRTVVQVHEAAPDVPIVVLSGHDDEELALRSVQASAEDYLVKGQADEVGLARSIRYALERHRLHVELERSARTLAKSDAKFRNLISTSADGMLVVSQAGVILFANPAAAELFGRQPTQLSGERFGFPLAADACLEVSVGTDRVVEMRVVATEWEDQPVWLASMRDVTEHRRSQAKLEDLTLRLSNLNSSLERLAKIDPLTELDNRRGLEASLGAEIQRARRSNSPLAAILLDFDDFKRINDSLGHAVGDVVLKEVAIRLHAALRPTDHLARIGGDEFLALLPDTRLGEAVQIAERLRLAVADSPLHLPSGPVHVTASLGIEVLPEGISSVEEVLGRMQFSLKHSKLGGKNRVSSRGEGETFAPTSSEDDVRALESGVGFRVVRQPILRLEDEKVVGWELLSRGPSPGFEMPGDFFRIALERNILTLVDTHCVKTCLRAARDLPAGTRCHVNLFPSTLLDTPADRLIDLFADQDRNLRFCVEISEQQFIGEPSCLRSHARALQEAGALVAIDDVGFGRSSLEALILLEPDVVKIDKNFVAGAARNPAKIRPLRRLVEVVGALGGELVAEGIESRDDLDLLRRLGVPLGQGFLWGVPEAHAAR
jgi:diguanylate cyclase (GGDEF)-like protein